MMYGTAALSTMTPLVQTNKCVMCVMCDDDVVMRRAIPLHPFTYYNSTEGNERPIKY
jgi:hypothetical protein